MSDQIRQLTSSIPLAKVREWLALREAFEPLRKAIFLAHDTGNTEALVKQLRSEAQGRQPAQALKWIAKPLLAKLMDRRRLKGKRAASRELYGAEPAPPPLVAWRSAIIMADAGNTEALVKLLRSGALLSARHAAQVMEWLSVLLRHGIGRKRGGKGHNLPLSQDHTRQTERLATALVILKGLKESSRTFLRDKESGTLRFEIPGGEITLVELKGTLRLQIPDGETKRVHVDYVDSMALEFVAKAFGLKEDVLNNAQYREPVRAVVRHREAAGTATRRARPRP